MSTILQKDAPPLRQKAALVPLSKIKSPEIRKLIREMRKAVDSEEDGVAIAAPQIGKSLRVFLIASRAYDLLNEKKRGQKSEGPQEVLKKKEQHEVFINPEILRSSKEKAYLEEGCLSVRWLYGKVERAKKVRIRALDEHGVPFEMGASGLLAQICQHEVDHLNGTLFIDKAIDIEDIPPEAEK